MSRTEKGERRQRRRKGSEVKTRNGNKQLEKKKKKKEDISKSQQFRQKSLEFPLVCPREQKYVGLDSLFNGDFFPPNLAITA